MPTASKSSGKFSRGYKGGRRSSDINSKPASEAFREACDRMGWNKFRDYCDHCGRSPAWCECNPKARTING